MLYTDEVAALYDLEHAGLRDDADLYLSYAQRSGGPILELGCGTGRLMAPLVEGGYEVTGVDASAPMLRLAERRLAALPSGRWRLVETVLEELAGVPEEGFGLALCAMNTWAHLADPADALRALERTRRALRPAGLLVLDLEDPERWAPGRGELLLAGAWEDDGALVTKTVSSLYEPREGVEHVTFLWDRVHGGKLERTCARTIMRPYRRAELEQLLERAGYTMEEALGSWEMEPYAGRGDRLILVAARLG